MLACKARVDGTSGYGSTALHLAAKYNFNEICTRLIGHGASLLIMNKGYETPMHVALANGHIKLTKYLFDQLGAHKLKFLSLVNPENQYTFLHCVVKCRASDFLSYIITHCLPVLEQRNGLGQTPLLLAMYLQDYESMQILMSNGASIMAEVSEFVDNHYWTNNLDVRHNPYFVGATTLHLANSRILELLLRQPKFPDIIGANNAHRCSPLHSAVIAKDFKKVWLLHKHGADIQQKNEEGYTSFHLAAISLAELIGYYLICECPALLLVTDKYGMTALHWAILKGFRTFVSLTLYLIQFYDLTSQLAQLRVTAEKVIVMGDAYHIKGFNYLDLFAHPAAQTVSKSKDMSPLLKEGKILAEQLNVSMLEIIHLSESDVELNL